MSARAPDYQLQLVEGLLPQIVAILQRDLQANLALVNPGAGYHAVRAYNTAPKDLYEAPPEVLVEPMSSVFARNEQVALTATHAFTVSTVLVAQRDTESLARAARDYARAMAMSLGRAMDLSDYRDSLPITFPDGSTGSTAGFAGNVIEVSITRVDWALKGSQNAQFARQPLVELEITAVEQ